MTVRIMLEFDSYAEALDTIGSLANIPNDQAGKGKPAKTKAKLAKWSGNGKSKPAPQAAPEQPEVLTPAAPPSPVSEAAPAAVGLDPAGVDVSDEAFASWLNTQNTPDNTQALVALLTSYGVNRGSELTEAQRREFIAKWVAR